MVNKRFLYIFLQALGWFLYILLAGVLNILSGKSLSTEDLFTLFFVFVTGLSLTHMYRHLILKYNWFQFNLLHIISRVLISSFVLGLIFEISLFLSSYIYVENNQIASNSTLIIKILNWAFILFLWSLIYFSFHYFERYRNEEIKNLKWQAAKNEIELNKLKSQLNPHFIFNAMNSIRALIDENPQKAKKSVNQLSNILRTTLQMGKYKTVSLEDELSVVVDYLELEKTRFEERLNYSIETQKDTLQIQIPALMLQTLVENGIKHGIAKLPKGGKIHINTYLDSNKLVVEIENTGQLNPHIEKENESGFGIANTLQRLSLLYENNAEFSINNHNKNSVLTRITIPKNTQL